MYALGLSTVSLAMTLPFLLLFRRTGPLAAAARAEAYAREHDGLEADMLGSLKPKHSKHSKHSTRSLNPKVDGSVAPGGPPAASSDNDLGSDSDDDEEHGGPHHHRHHHHHHHHHRRRHRSSSQRQQHHKVFDSDGSVLAPGRRVSTRVEASRRAALGAGGGGGGAGGGRAVGGGGEHRGNGTLEHYHHVLREMLAS